ncbi:hypothetical protein FS320_37285 [Microvirga tunisiensis]|uniref:Uncharacterized protein n=1 Tax=Microvirga tunisiensis TaxID=2108360 RepID=A0A5N7N519_9HYPH|nr:hypothetical protein [Microvirga tunisiensis]MPR30516.1 hypothetical protein [Microvirga tunisiensis]
MPIARSPQPEPSINLPSGWLRGTLFATALSFVTTAAPVLAATDDIKVTNFLLDNVLCGEAAAAMSQQISARRFAGSALASD